MNAVSTRNKGGQTVVRTIPANGRVEIPVTGKNVHVVSAPKKLRIFLNGGGWSDCYTGTGLGVGGDTDFDGITVQNQNAEDVTAEIYVGYAEFKDARQLSTQTDPNFASPTTVNSETELVASGAPELLLAADANRGEVWLWTDEPANLAWWAESAARLAAPKDFQKIGLNLEGLTKIKTKAAIYVYALAGVKIGAIVFKS